MLSVKAVPSCQLEMVFFKKKKVFFPWCLSKVGLVYYYLLKWEEELEEQTSWPWGSKWRGQRGNHTNSEEIFPGFQENLGTSDTACLVSWLDFVKHHQHMISHSIFLRFTDSGLRHYKWEIIVAYYWELKLAVALMPVLVHQLDLGTQSVTSFTPHASTPGLQLRSHTWPGTPANTLSSSECRMLAATSRNTILTRCQGGEGDKGHQKCVLVHLPAYPLLYFTGIWLQQPNLKGGDFKAGIWHFTKKLPSFFQWRIKSLTPSQMQRQALFCPEHLWRVTLGNTGETTDILSPLFMPDETGSTWPR